MTLSKSRLGVVGVVASAALCVASLGVTGAVATAAGGVPATLAAAKYTPGSPGLGDPYFPREGNGGYDATHYDLDLTYLPDTHHLEGTVTIDATATQNLSRFNLDFKNFKVDGITVNDAPATFTRDDQELAITPKSGLPNGKQFTVAVTYEGTPHTVVHSPIVFGAPYGWIYTPDGAFVGCEPNAASTWFPSNDHPSDKATFTFNISVPSGTKVVANGDLTGQGTSGGMDSFQWTEKQPMATYLATIDIGKWKFHETKTDGGIPSFVAVDPDLEAQVESSGTIQLTNDITDYWAKLFGKYAFSSTGGIIDNVPHVGFSLETQTRPLYGFVPGSGTASHELAHEWFGDSLSVKSWDNIWLNEGFATYVSWLWIEHTSSTTAYQTAQSLYNSIPAGDSFWKQSIADPQRNTMFSSAVYNRGGMTLAALRHKIGDKDFFELMKTWATQHRFGNVTTKQFTSLASKISGQNLDGLFKTWLWDQVKPPKL
jgi:aminopeptidase N